MLAHSRKSGRRGAEPLTHPRSQQHVRAFGGTSGARLVQAVAFPHRRA